MTSTPYDAPRPTSELVKRLLNPSGIGEPMDHAAMEEAAASLQSLEARNKELEGALDVALDTIILPHLFDKDSLRIVAAKIRAALHPATKTEER